MKKIVIDRRWVLAVAICAGWLLELPAERRSRFWPFAVGAAGFTVLLLIG